MEDNMSLNEENNVSEEQETMITETEQEELAVPQEEPSLDEYVLEAEQAEKYYKKKKRNKIVAIAFASLLSILLIVYACIMSYRTGVEKGLMASINGYIASAAGGVSDSTVDVSGMSISTINGLSNTTLEKLAYIQQIINQSFLFTEDAESADYETGVIKGYVDALGDPYTVYYTPEEYKELMESNSGEYCGIGVVVQQDASTGVIKVVRPYKDCPGAEAGIEAEDIVYKVAGEEVTGVDINLVVSKIRGEENTSVDMTLYRPSTGEYLDVTVTRKKIEIESVTFEMLEDHIGYIALDSFNETTAGQFKKAYEELSKEGMTGLVVDIRNNGGGLLTSVVEILDYLLPEGVITYTEEKDGYSDVYSSEKSSALDVPCAVLVNGNSASASEIFTGAMQDYNAGTIVGTQTFGKGIVQIIIPFSDSSAMKITMAKYFTPNGVCIHGTGITPDIVIESDTETEEDDQLEKAIEVVKEGMNK